MQLTGVGIDGAAALTLASAALGVRALRHAPERGSAHAPQAAPEA